MAAETTLHPVTADQHELMARLDQLYRHDLSEFRDALPDEDGQFRTRLPDYLPEVPDPDRRAYLVRHDGVVAGFALIRGLVEPPRILGEFFVIRRFRRHGVGHAAVRELLRRHPGPWQIAFQEENPKAARFWRRVATEAVGSAFREELRPVPDKAWLPPDVWLFLDTADSTADSTAGHHAG